MRAVDTITSLPPGSTSSVSLGATAVEHSNKLILPRAPRKGTGSRGPRKRNFSHKVRSGCDTCKIRHIKCDEAKPTCIRCRNARFDCHYNLPKTWVFRQKNQPAESTEPSTIHGLEIEEIVRQEPIYPVLPENWLTLEEQRSIGHWLLATSPWLAWYSGKAASQTWQVVLPRFIPHYPSVRHLLVAVAMLDERLCNPNAPDVELRTRRIVQQYNTAIKRLTSGNASQLEIVMASMLAWLLETFNNNVPIAKMHINSSGRLLQKLILELPENINGEEADILRIHLTEAHKQCVGYMKTEVRPDESFGQYGTNMFSVMVHKDRPQSLTGLKQLKSEVKEFYNQLNLAQELGTGINITEALHARRQYETEMLTYRHVAKEPAENLVALHHWLNMVNNLLSATGNDEDIVTFGDISAMDYTMNRIEELIGVKSPSPEFKADLNETLDLTLINVIRFARREKDVERARGLMRRLDLDLTRDITDIQDT